MLACDKCGKKITPDNLAFHGGFTEFYALEDLDICRDCAPFWSDIVKNFLGLDIPEDEPISDGITVELDQRKYSIDDIRKKCKPLPIEKPSRS